MPVQPCWKTSDGSIFDNEAKADRYESVCCITDLLHTMLEKDDLIYTCLNAALDTVDVIPDVHVAKALSHRLSNEIIEKLSSQFIKYGSALSEILEDINDK